jgi:hypothetical protein
MTILLSFWYSIRPKNEVIEELEGKCQKDVKLLLDILPGYEATDFYGACFPMMF